MRPLPPRYKLNNDVVFKRSIEAPDGGDILKDPIGDMVFAYAHIYHIGL